MANCENCYHFHMCDLQNRLEDYQECKHFKDDSMINEALKKQMPMKPKDEGWLYCPVCGKDVCVEQPEYCSDCGQKLDWSGE